MASSGTVIVFGPTGNIASVTASVAQELGSKVYLAMRDPKKAIPGLSSEQEAAGGFVRIQADLTQPDTVAAAVSKAGAKRAYLYLAWGTPDNMKSTFQALKSAGIELVVFLSSASVGGDLEAIPESDFIPYQHARAEISLREVFSPDEFVSVRPGGFATNAPDWWKAGFSDDEIKIPYPGAKFDWITPQDMGRVCGSILVKGQQGGQNVVYIFGPELISQGDALGIVAKVLGKSVKISEVSEDEGVELFKKIMPEPMAKYLVSMFGHYSGGESFVTQSGFKEGTENVLKYAEKPGVKFDEWVQENKELFVQ